MMKEMMTGRDFDLAHELIEDPSYDVTAENLEEAFGYDDPEIVEIPAELLRRLYAEAEYMRTIREGTATGTLITLGGETTAEGRFGIGKRLKYEFRVDLVSPDGERLADEELDKIVDYTLDGWRGILQGDVDLLRTQIREAQENLEKVANLKEV